MQSPSMRRPVSVEATRVKEPTLLCNQVGSSTNSSGYPTNQELTRRGQWHRASTCGSLAAMNRVSAIFAILSLLTVPLAPIAWGMACESSSCTMMCCVPHGSHSRTGKPMVCHCAGKSERHPPDIGLVAPIPLAAPAARAEIVAPKDARRNFFAFSESTASGFLSAPFEPPRA